MSHAALGPQVASQTMGFYTTDVPFEVAKARFFHHMDGCLLLQWMAFVDSLIRWMLRFSMSGCFLQKWWYQLVQVYQVSETHSIVFLQRFSNMQEAMQKSGAYFAWRAKPLSPDHSY